MKALITGVNGFIGARHAELLKRQGASLVGIDLQAAEAAHSCDEYLQLDVGSPDAAQRLRTLPPFDFILHAGGISGFMVETNNPQRIFDVNVAGTMAILDLARRNHGCRLILCSTSMVYGPDAEPGIVGLLPGAVLGMALEAEKRAAAVVDTVASRSSGVVRAATAPPAVQRVLRPLEDRLWRWNEVARREQNRNQAQAAALIPVIVQQVTENVIAQLDFVRIVEQIPIDDIAGAIDIEAIVQRIDLGGVIRESTASLTMEGVDAVRSQSVAVDEWSARVVDKLLFRKRPRDTGFGEDEAEE
jgi:NAD(P)-dependent dehydrogenase (short-subunit alcohol dehydrogenase family)